MSATQMLTAGAGNIADWTTRATAKSQTGKPAVQTTSAQAVTVIKKIRYASHPGSAARMLTAGAGNTAAGIIN